MEILLEIGVEELPARFLKTSMEQIEKKMSEKLQKNRIDYSEMKTFGTPRRLVLYINGCDKVQKDLVQTNVGPSKNVAYDHNGQPTKAALGFAKSQGIDIKDLKLIKNDKGEYIAATKFLKGKETKFLLKEYFEDLINNFSFPKSMKWGLYKVRFARPIRWLLCMVEEEIIELEIEGLKASNLTRGHRFFGKEKIEIKSIKEYFSQMEENYVIIDIEERRNKVLELVKRSIKNDEKVLIDDALLDEVTNLVEYPYPIIGSFNSEFLEVPQEILIITMKTHQRYFPIVDKDNKLLSKFIVIRNGIESSEEVKKGNEKVLGARLSDARFFFNEDIKKPIEENIEKLKNVVFQKDLGTIYDKSERSIKIAEKICDELKLDQTSKLNCLRSVKLAKADLVSNVISEKEYTKLQGFMGSIYAKLSGEKDEVSTSIYEHYFPRFQNDKLPETKIGAITAIADRIDTVVGCFSVGLIPSGSQDPYALRRASLGIINIILNSRLELNLKDIIENALSILALENKVKGDIKNVKNLILNFFTQRLVNVFVDKGFKKDIVKSVVTLGFNNIMDTENKISSLEKITKLDDFEEIIQITKRVKNISKDFNEINIVVKDFVEKVEENLYDYFISLEEKTKENILNKNYDEYFDNILQGKKVISEFFDNVMVMDKDEKIKNNRLSLIKSLDVIFNKVAVISLVE